MALSLANANGLTRGQRPQQPTPDQQRAEIEAQRNELDARLRADDTRLLLQRRKALAEKRKSLTLPDDGTGKRLAAEIATLDAALTAKRRELRVYDGDRLAKGMALSAEKDLLTAELIASAVHH